MRGMKWTWAAVVAAIGLFGAMETPADAEQQPDVMKVEIEEGTSPDGDVVALRLRADGYGMALCGTGGGAEFKKVGEAMLSTTVQPFVFKTEGLDCEVIVSWEESGRRILVRGGRVQAGPPPADPPDAQERPAEAEGSDPS